jgi:hypothetical protein
MADRDPRRPRHFHGASILLVQPAFCLWIGRFWTTPRKTGPLTTEKSMKTHSCLSPSSRSPSPAARPTKTKLAGAAPEIPRAKAEATALPSPTLHGGNGQIPRNSRKGKGHARVELRQAPSPAPKSHRGGKWTAIHAKGRWHRDRNAEHEAREAAVGTRKRSPLARGGGPTAP